MQKILFNLSMFCHNAGMKLTKLGFWIGKRGIVYGSKDKAYREKVLSI